MLTFNKKNELKTTERLHHNIISIEFGDLGEKKILASIHTHLPETGDLISATDICTLMLYEKYTGWDQHIVLSDQSVSIWDCKKDQLVVMTRKAWDKISAGQKN